MPRTYTHTINKFHYVWNEWFKSLDEVAADPRCAVDKITFLERLKGWPIEQAVKEIPDWHPDDIEAERKKPCQYLRCSEEVLRKRLRQGFPPKMALHKTIVARDLLLYALNISKEQYFEVHKRVAPGILQCKRTFAVIGTPVAYGAFCKRLDHGWEVKVAALCDFMYLAFGQKYKSRADITAKHPWIPIETNNFRFKSLEEKITC